MAGDVDYLPLDLISRILLSLPVSSLVRLKSVCKPWLSLLESSDFIYKHFHSDGEQQQMNLFVLSREYVIGNPQQLSLFSGSNKSELLLDFPIIDDPYQIDFAKLVASCHGIICLQQDRIVCLWNPATKQCTNLPPLPVVSEQGAIGFGFDPKANDYKLVTINLVNLNHVFHIYSLSSDSWRKIDCFAPPDMLIVSDIKTPYRDRIHCWFAWTGGGGEFDPAVYTFDFSYEVFGNIPLPRGRYISKLFILMENIAFVGGLINEVNGGSTTNAPNKFYEIWMLSDYEVKESWTQLYSIDPVCKSNEWITGFSNNGDFLLFQESKHLCLYDLVTREVMNLPVHASDDFDVVTYRESMLSVKRGDGAANAVTSMDRNTRTLIHQSITGNSSWGNSDIHKAAVFHILLWLPVVSLQRFKSVCKSWHSLIKSSDFVTHHLVLHHLHHKIDNFNFILHSTDITYYPLFEDSSHHSPNTSCTCLLAADKLELLDLPICDWGLHIVTSFNGILCLHNNGEVYLWNPATKQFRVTFPDGLSNEGGIDYHIGFGFDVKTNSYKLVRFYCRFNGSAAHFYSLSTDSWTTIHDEILPTVESIYSGLDAPYRDEIYCWLVDTCDSYAILSFDFSNEVFRTIPLPDSINNLSLTLVLSVFRDKIVCISLGERYDSDDVENWHCEIWMMNEYAIEESWVKLYRVGPFSKDWRFKMYYSKKNEDCIMLLKDGQLYDYDLVTQETKRLPCQIQGPDDYQVVAYEESLVPVKRGCC